MKKLTKGELYHICDSMIGEEEIKRKLRQIFQLNRGRHLRCWECISIAEKLGVEIPETYIHPDLTQYIGVVA